MRSEFVWNKVARNGWSVALRAMH